MEKPGRAHPCPFILISEVDYQVFQAAWSGRHMDDPAAHSYVSPMSSAPSIPLGVNSPLPSASRCTTQLRVTTAATYSRHTNPSSASTLVDEDVSPDAASHSQHGGGRRAHRRQAAAAQQNVSGKPQACTARKGSTSTDEHRSMPCRFGRPSNCWHSPPWWRRGMGASHSMT